MKRWPELIAVLALLVVLVGAALMQLADDRGVAKGSPSAVDKAGNGNGNSFAIRGVRVFDGDAIDIGWQASTDEMAGGTSVVDYTLAPGGAGGSRGSLEVAGEIRPGFAYPWAGVMFTPARQPMQPVDLGKRRTLVFQVRGDGRRYSAMLISGDSMQKMPAMQSFPAGPDWREVRLPLSDFAGADLGQVRAIGFTAGRLIGRFSFWIDRVELL